MATQPVDSWDRTGRGVTRKAARRNILRSGQGSETEALIPRPNGSVVQAIDDAGNRRWTAPAATREDNLKWH